MATDVVSVTKHRYRWRAGEIFSVVLFAAIPVALYFFTTQALFLSVGMISLFIAIALIYIGWARKRKSTLKATVYTDGTLTVSGNGLEALNNKIKLRNVTKFKTDPKAYHPTLVLNTGSGPSFYLPRRVAEEEPLNSFIRETLAGKTYYVDDAAKPILTEILEESGKSVDVNFSDVEPVQEANSFPSYETVIVEDNINTIPEETVEETVTEKTVVVEQKPVVSTGQRVQPKRKTKSKR